MIKANELRRGNFVMHNGKLTLCDNMVLAEAYDNYKTPKTWDFSDFNPIPLSPEVLLACGFTKHSNSNEYWTFWQLPNGWYISESHHVEESAGVVKGEFYYSEEFIHIPNLHWLQNFYFFNTKTELTYKP
jgi:hypothetical protein